MSKNGLVLILLAGLFYGSAFGLESASNEPLSDPQALKIIRDLKSKYLSFQSITVAGVEAHEKKSRGASSTLNDEPANRVTRINFSLKLKRPELYLIEADNSQLVAYNAGEGDYLISGGLKEKQDGPVWGKGVPAVPGAIIIVLFSGSQWGSISEDNWDKPLQEKLEGEDCYVLTQHLSLADFTMWLAKDSMFVRKTQMVMSAEPPASLEPGQEPNEHQIRQLLEDANPKNAENLIILTETYTDFEPDPNLSPADFLPKNTLADPNLP